MDSRVALARNKIDVDSVLLGIHQQYRLSLDRLDSLRNAVDFVLVGLISARELSQEIKELFPEKNQEIIETLNQKIFKPVLEYVKAHQPIEPSVTPMPTKEQTPFEQSNIEILKQEDTGQDTLIEDLFPNMPTKPGFAPNIKTTDKYQEQI